MPGVSDRATSERESEQYDTKTEGVQHEEPAEEMCTKNIEGVQTSLCSTLTELEREGKERRERKNREKKKRQTSSG